MGKKAPSKRKPVLQLKESKKPQGTAATHSSPAATSEVEAAPEGMDTKLASFLQEMTTVASEPAGASSVMNGVSAETQVPQAKASSDAPPSSSPPTETPPITYWRELVDSKTQHRYYWNMETNATSWTLPEGGVVVPEEGAETGGGEEAIDELMDNYPYLKKDVVAEAKPDSPTAASQASTAAKTDKQADVGTVEKAARGGMKRSSPEDEPATTGNQAAKKPRKSQGNSVGDLSPPRRVGTTSAGSTPSSTPGGAVSKQAEQMMRFQVSSITDQFQRKLEYLHVSVENLTALEKLAIQLQTRLADWKENGLSTKYMLAKLKLMNEELLKCESMAAPEGWRYVWDSSSSRYQFQNVSTGEMTWEPPIEDLVNSANVPEQPASELMEVSQEGTVTCQGEEEKEGPEEAKEEEEEEEEEGGGVVIGPALPPPASQVQSAPPDPPAISAGTAHAPPLPSDLTVPTLPAAAAVSVAPPPVQPPVPADPYQMVTTEAPPPQPPMPTQPVSREGHDSSEGCVQPTTAEGPGVRRSSEDAYFSPTADYLGSMKLEEGMTMPPPMPRYNKKALDIQRRQEEKERLAKIEREKRPITKHDVREKLQKKSLLPTYYLQRQRERERAQQQQQQQQQEQEQLEQQQQQLSELPPARAAPDADCELISEFPPPNFGGSDEPEAQPPPSRPSRPQATTRRGVQDEGRAGKTESPRGGREVKSSGRRQPRDFSPETDSPGSDAEEAAAVEEPAKPTTSILDLNSLRRGVSGGVATEQELREKLTHRFSFKFGRPSSGSSPSQEQPASATSAAGQASSSSLSSSERGELSKSQAAAAGEHVVESTGEMQQQVRGSEEAWQPTVEPLPTGIHPQEGRVAPETGMVEGEPGEIVEDGGGMAPAEEAEEEDGGVVEMRDLEEGEMEEEEERGRDQGVMGGQEEGGHYMEQETTAESRQGDLATEEASEDDSADSPAPSEQKSGRGEHRRSPSPSPDPYKSSSRSKKKSRRHDSDSDYDRYSDSGYKRSSRRSSRHHHHSSSSGSKRHRRDRSRDRYREDSDSGDEYYYSSSSRRRRGGGRDRSPSPDDDYPHRRHHRGSKSSMKGSHYRGGGSGGKYRSPSYDSDRDSRRRSGLSSGKHKKKDKKKKRKRSTSRNGSTEASARPAPNVLVGKVGKISTVRPLGQEKKPEEAEGEKSGAAEGGASSQQQQQQGAGAVGGGVAGYGMDPQQMSAMYYQQPSTGQVPYYTSYPAYQYPYTQDQGYSTQQPQQQQEGEGKGEEQRAESGGQKTEWQWGGADPVKWAAEAAAKAAQQEEGGVEAPQQEGGGVEAAQQEEGGVEATVSDQAQPQPQEEGGSGEKMEEQEVGGAGTGVEASAAIVEEKPVTEVTTPAAAAPSGRSESSRVRVSRWSEPHPLPPPPPPPAAVASPVTAAVEDMREEEEGEGSGPMLYPVPVVTATSTASVQDTPITTTAAAKSQAESVEHRQGAGRLEAVGTGVGAGGEATGARVALTPSIPPPVQEEQRKAPPLPPPPPPPTTITQEDPRVHSGQLDVPAALATTVPAPQGAEVKPAVARLQSPEEIAECEMEIEEEEEERVGVSTAEGAKEETTPLGDDTTTTNQAAAESANTEAEPEAANLYEGVGEITTITVSTEEEKKAAPTATTSAASEPQTSTAAAACFQAATTQSTAYNYTQQQQQQQGYNYAYAQQYAAQAAYMQQAAAYGAYGGQWAMYGTAYPGYGATTTPYYGAYSTAYQTPMPAPSTVAASTPSAVPVTKSAGGKEQMKDMMDKWNAFKEEEKRH